MKSLPFDRYQEAKNKLEAVTINHLFARSVLERHVEGEVYSNDLSNPTIFCVIHPYRMALLYGDLNLDFLKENLGDIFHRFGSRQKEGIWLQIFPHSFEKQIDEILGASLLPHGDPEIGLKPRGSIIKNRRINFRFNPDKYLQFRDTLDINTYQFCCINQRLFQAAEGSVVPKFFWNNADDLRTRGIGYALLVDGVPVSIAFSSFVHDQQLELGMETAPNRRKRGYASIICAKLIDHCLENGYEPIWACSKGNPASFNLAVKLGFEPLPDFPYYILENV